MVVVDKQVAGWVWAIKEVLSLEPSRISWFIECGLDDE